MKYTMTKPCKNCPFRTDIAGYLSPARAREIAAGLLSGATFTCHKTNEFEEGDEGWTETVETPSSQHCGGALIFLEKQERPNQMMRIAERLGLYDMRKLDMDAPVFDSARAFVAAQKR
jgi:hypothetical protein